MCVSSLSDCLLVCGAYWICDRSKNSWLAMNSAQGTEEKEREYEVFAPVVSLVTKIKVRLLLSCDSSVPSFAIAACGHQPMRTTGSMSVCVCVCVAFSLAGSFAQIRRSMIQFWNDFWKKNRFLEEFSLSISKRIKLQKLQNVWKKKKNTNKFGNEPIYLFLDFGWSWHQKIFKLQSTSESPILVFDTKYFFFSFDFKSFNFFVKI